MLIAALRDPACYPHPVDGVEVHETLISWVVLAGPYAYKIKKPVALEFLDFSTLERRRHACEEELRLNRRLAPQLYLDVVELRGSVDAPRIGGAGPVVEYALRMRRFPQEALASRVLARGELTPALVADFARELARFHSKLPPARCATPYGSTEVVLRNALQNFDQIAPLIDRDEDWDEPAALRDWTEREFLKRYAELRGRREEGCIRECHGDLHLGNIVLLEGRLVPFDCLEFNPDLRWNDVMSDVAFLVMDLMDQGAHDLAWTFLTAYLEATGAYSGIAVLRFYLVYRAMVRAKIHLMRAAQGGTAKETARLMEAYRRYVALARWCSAPRGPALVLMHGLSGSGKSALAAALAPALGAIRIRSDVERKRLHGLPALARSGSGVDADLYDERATDATYERLAEDARAVIAAGYVAIVDAACLKRSQRMLLVRTAEALAVPAVIVETRAPEAVLRERIARRDADPSEATVAVLERQIATAEPIAPPEIAPVIVVNTTAADVAHLAHDVAAGLRRSFSRPPLIHVKTRATRAANDEYCVDAAQFV